MIKAFTSYDHFLKKEKKMDECNSKKSVELSFQNVLFVCIFSIVISYFLGLHPGFNIYPFEPKALILNRKQPMSSNFLNNTISGYPIVNKSVSTHSAFHTGKALSSPLHRPYPSKEEVTYYAITSSSKECDAFAQTHFPSILESFGATLLYHAKLPVGLYFMFRFPAYRVLPEKELHDIPCLQKIEKDTLMTTTQASAEEQPGSNIRENLNLFISKRNMEGMDLNGLDLLDGARDGYYTYDYTGENVIVYVLDSGLDEAHPDLEGRGKVIYEAPGTETQKLGSADCDRVAHGSHVSGIIAGKYTGVAKKALIRMLRVKNCEKEFSLSNTLAALDFLERNLQKPSLISLSIGPTNKSVSNTLFYQRIKYFVETLKVPVILSAGNDYPGTTDCDETLTTIQGIITVGSVDNNFNRLPTSNFGPCVDVFGPGENIWSHSNLTRGAIYRKNTGTSQATPFVAGIGALLIQKAGRHLTPEELKELIMDDTVDLVKQASLQRGVKRPFVTTPLSPQTLDSTKILKNARKRKAMSQTWLWIAVLCACIIGTLVLLGVVFCIVRCHFKKKEKKKKKIKTHRDRQTV